MNGNIDLAKSGNASFTKILEDLSGQNISACYQCGNCTAGCPAGFAYDLQVSQIMRGVQLGLREEVLNSRSLWMCLSCATCSLRCPNGIDVSCVMETLRHMAKREGRVSVPRVEKFWLSFLEMVRLFGRSFEIGTMVLYMLRSMRVFTDLDLAPKALARRKLGFRPHAIPGGADAVARIFQRYRARARKEGGRP